jgi:hypothetical protein
MEKYRETQDEFPKNVKVTAYSGYKANERPLSFIMNRERIEVREIIDRWYGVESDYFKILGQDGMVYILKWHRLLDVWLVVSRMQMKPRSAGSDNEVKKPGS